MTITTRPVTQADKSDWETLWDKYLTFYKTERGQDVKDLSWARIMDPNEPMFAHVAVDDADRPVGLVNFLYHRNFWQAENICYLSDLFVLPATRGTGAGRKLITSVTEKARADKVREIYWLTEKDNTTAKRLYDSVVAQFPFDVYLIEV